MGFWIITIALFVIIVGLILWRIFDEYAEISLLMIPIAITALSFLIGCLIAPIQCRNEVYIFQQRSAYFVEHSVENGLEDLSLTQNKLELNKWLYESQFRKQFYPAWSFMPEEVMDLKPIE